MIIIHIPKETIKRFVQGVNIGKRSQAQGFPLKAGFRVTDKDKNEAPKSSEEMVVLPKTQIPTTLRQRVWRTVKRNGRTPRGSMLLF
jgi:hypothetical protein